MNRKNKSKKSKSNKSKSKSIKGGNGIASMDLMYPKHSYLEQA